MKEKSINLFVFVIALALTAFLTGCASTGSSQLSKSAVDEFVEGKTTKDEIAAKLLHPQQMMNFDKKGLEEYLYRVFLKRPPESMFPEDKYEVWTYDKWSYVASPIPFTSRETQTNAIFIFSSKDVLVKKFFGEKGKFSL